MTGTDPARCRTRVPAVVGALALLVIASGCTSFEIARVRNDIARDVPSVEVNDGFSVSFGRASLGLARLAVSGTSDGSDSDEVLRHALRMVRKVEIGRYPFVPKGGALEVGALPSLARYQRDEWSRVLSVRDDDEVAFVFVREQGMDLKQALVVSFEDEMLTLVKLSGNLDEALSLILQSVESPLRPSPGENVGSDITTGNS